MDNGTTVPELKRVMGSEGLALLKQHNLLRPLVQQMLMQEIFSQVVVTDEDLDAARLEMLEERGYKQLEQWPELLKELEIAEDNLIERLRQNIRRRTFMRDRFAPKAEARFLERKNQLDKVVYSLLRLENSFLARGFICRLILENQTSLIWPSATPRGQNATPMESLAPFL